MLSTREQVPATAGWYGARLDSRAGEGSQQRDSRRSEQAGFRAAGRSEQGQLRARAVRATARDIGDLHRQSRRSARSEQGQSRPHNGAGTVPNGGIAP